MKSHRVPRVARKVVVVCLALAVLLVVGLAFAAEPTARAMPKRARVTNADARTTKNETIRTKYPTRPLSLRDGDATILAFPPALR